MAQMRKRLDTLTWAMEENLLKVQVISSGITASVNEVSGTTSSANLSEGLDLLTIASHPSKARAKEVFFKYIYVLEVGEEEPTKSSSVKHHINMDGGLVQWLPYRMVPPSKFKEFAHHLCDLFVTSYDLQVQSFEHDHWPCCDQICLYDRPLLLRSIVRSVSDLSAIHLFCGRI